MILTSPILLTNRPKTAPSNSGAVVINHGTILALGTAEKLIKRYPGHSINCFHNTVLLPGLVNTHVHIELPSLLDAIQGKTFPDWVLNLINAKKLLTDHDYKHATKINIDSLIQSGTTTVGEICTHNISPAYLRQSGLRAAMFQEIISMGSRVRGQGSGIQKRSRNSELIQNGLSPHTPYTVSEAVLLRIRKSTEIQHLKLSMHVAESKDEIKLLQGMKSGLEKLYQFANWDLASAPEASSSFEYLKRIGLLSPNLLAVHAVQVTDNDIRLIKKSGTSIAHCPRSNKETHVGRMPLKKFLDTGITVGLGTDSLASSPSLNMWDEMRYAYKIHKKDGVTAKEIFRLATIGGAAALGMDKLVGTLEPGKRADIIAVPLPKKDTGDIYSDLLRETKSSIMTMVNGKILYQQ